MKKILFVACFLCLAVFSANAQRYAILDTKFILDRLPEYKDAQKQLDQLSEVSLWVDQYRQHWESKLNGLETYLKKIKKERNGKQKVRHKRP